VSRILGFVIGSLLSLAALLLLVGLPRFHGGEGEAVGPVEAIPGQMPGPALSSPTGPPAPATRVETSIEPPIEPGPEPDEPPTTVADAVAITEVVAADAMPAPPREVAEPAWRTFWTPFRSRVAAEGFVGRLESLTGLDYRVAKEDIDRYHVQFAYRGEAELDSHLAAISAATGLELAERRP